MGREHIKCCVNFYILYFIFDYLLSLLLPIISYVASTSEKICQYTLIFELSTLIYVIAPLHLILTFNFIDVAFVRIGQTKYAPTLFNMPSHSIRHIYFIFITNIPLYILSTSLSRCILINNYRITCEKYLDTLTINKFLNEEPILKLWWLGMLFSVIFILGTISRLIFIQCLRYKQNDKDTIV